MKRLSYIIALFAGLFLLNSCYDDTQVRQEIAKVEAELSGYESSVAAFQSQLNALNALKNSSFVTYLGMNEKGNYVVTYMNNGGEKKTVELAVQSDVVGAPLVSTKMDTDGKLYWVTTDNKGENVQFITDADGKKMLVGGTAPVISIDENGYWTVAGQPLLGLDGQPVLATDLSNVLFTDIAHNPETGLVEFSLVGGDKFSLRMYEALAIRLESAPVIAITDYATPAKVKFYLTGSDAENAMVDYFTAYNVDVELNTWTYTLTAKLKEGATEGNVVLMANVGKNTVLKPIFFTYGPAEIQQPLWDSKFGTGGHVSLEGEMTEFDLTVSHTIDYTMTIAEDCSSWLKVSPAGKALMTTTHSFLADRYENPLGLYREGIISFYNKPYDVTVDVKVRQMPVVEQGSGVPGIATPGDLYQFALAVNSGSSIQRFMNSAGEVVLLNDIDVSALTDWTPIGGGLATGQPQYKNLVTPFSGVFNGQDHSITGINWTFKVDEGTTDLFGFFGALSNATVKNLTFGKKGDKMTLVGAASNVVAVGAIAGHAIGSKMENVTNYVSVELADRNAEVPGDNPNGILMMLGGIVGNTENCTIGGEGKDYKVTNYGNVTTGHITNQENGGTGMNVGGIVGFAKGVDNYENIIRYCYNYGGVSAPTGRGGGIIGTIGGGTAATSKTTVTACFNYGTIQDDAVGQYAGKPVSETYDLKRMGGIVGGTITNVTGILVENCEHHGNVFSQMGCRTGGFIGHCQVSIVGCVNKGIILGGKKEDHKAGWACGFNGSKDQIKSCAMGGKVGYWEDHGANPTSAPAATADNACGYKNSERFDPSSNF